MLGGFEAAAEFGAGAHEAGADGAFGQVEDGGDFRGGEFVDSAEEEGLTEVWGEGVDEAAEESALLGVGGELLGAAGGVGEIVFGCGIERLRDGAGLEAVQADAPDRLGEKGSFVREVAPGFSAEQFEKSFLDGVFCVGGVAEEADGDAEEVTAVAVDERGEGGFAGGWRGIGDEPGAGWLDGLGLLIRAQGPLRR